MTRVFVLLTCFLATPALAHHPLDGQPMETFAHGLLSGLGHTVLGFDHLFFVLAMGVAARFAGLPWRGPLVYLAAMLVGCAGLYAGIGVPLQEVMIALSLVVVGGVLASGRPLTPAAMALLFAGFGLFHGAGLGGSLAAQEGGVSAAVLAGYLLGLGVVQYALAVGAGLLVDRVGASPLPARMVGAMVAGAGVLLCLELAEGSVLALLTS